MNHSFYLACPFLPSSYHIGESHEKNYELLQKHWN
ncbi:hypothetical protein EMGBS15_12090 [Filimonas sp.]|nr:hypothetical protein EMGBS15_12090 [Filimonas sp.]